MKKMAVLLCISLILCCVPFPDQALDISVKAGSTAEIQSKPESQSESEFESESEPQSESEPESESELESESEPESELESELESESEPESESRDFQRPYPGENAAVRILFIGNSYTKNNNFSGYFYNLCRSTGADVYVLQIVKGGHSLFQASNPKDQEGHRIRYLLSHQRWDYVILQDRHRLPVTKPKRMEKAIRRLKPYIEASGAKMVLYMNWATLKKSQDYHKRPFKHLTRSKYQARIKKIYRKLAKEYGALIAPVGTAFNLCMKRYRKIRLVRNDGSHPREEGSYLAACVIYATIFGKNPTKLSYRGTLSAKKARKLRRIARKATRIPQRVA